MIQQCKQGNNGNIKQMGEALPYQQRADIMYNTVPLTAATETCHKEHPKNQMTAQNGISHYNLSNNTHPAGWQRSRPQFQPQ
jgi:hypothetical protein